MDGQKKRKKTEGEIEALPVVLLRRGRWGGRRFWKPRGIRMIWSLLQRLNQIVSVVRINRPERTLSYALKYKKNTNYGHVTQYRY